MFVLVGLVCWLGSHSLLLVAVWCCQRVCCRFLVWRVSFCWLQGLCFCDLFFTFKGFIFLFLGWFSMRGVLWLFCCRVFGSVSVVFCVFLGFVWGKK